MDHTIIVTKKRNSSHLQHLYVTLNDLTHLSETVSFVILLQICIADIEPTVMVSTSEVSEREEKGHPEEEQHPRGDPVMGPILKSLVAEWKQGDAMLSKQGP